MKNKTNPTTIPKKRKVLDEDEYISQVSNIIVRDFYPELPELKQKLKELTSQSSTPQLYSTFLSSTPSITSTPTQITSNSSETQFSETNSEFSTSKPPSKKFGLDQFHATHESEDNKSFEVVLKQKQDEHTKKYFWAYGDDDHSSNEATQLLLTNGDSSSQPLLLEDNNDNKPSLITWKYKVRNDLMNDPEAKPRTAEELSQFTGPPKEIIHENTRLTKSPFENFKKPLLPNGRGGKSGLAMQTSEYGGSSASSSATSGVLRGVRGVDTSKKVLLSDLHDKLQERYSLISAIDTTGGNGSGGSGGDNNGIYDFVTPPSLLPSESSPLVTWGTISTPVHIGGGDQTPLRGSGYGDDDNKGQSHYKIPSTPIREKIAMELSEKNHLKSRIGKVRSKKIAETSLKRLSSPSVSPSFSSSSYSSSPSSSISPSFKFTNSLLSPKSSSRFGSFDAQLSKSYRSPSTPKHISSTPKLFSEKSITPSRSLEPSLPLTSSASKSDSSTNNSSLLDNLLKI